MLIHIYFGANFLMQFNKWNDTPFLWLFSLFIVEGIPLLDLIVINMATDIFSWSQLKINKSL